MRRLGLLCRWYFLWGLFRLSSPGKHKAQVEQLDLGVRRELLRVNCQVRSAERGLQGSLG